MYKPSSYPDHNKSLDKFISLFNSASPKDIVAAAFQEEQFIHDGEINLWGEIIKFDWEKRQDWDQEFPYATLGQFERKFKEVMKVDLAIICNIGETKFITAWHSQFSDQKIRVARETEFDEKEIGYMRLTEDFVVFDYEQMAAYKRWLLKSYPKILKKTHTCPTNH